jgi:hypothetical protein
VPIRNVTDVWPCGTVTVTGISNTQMLGLKMVTAAPPEEAGPLSVRVPVAGVPPSTSDGSMTKEASAASVGGVGGGAVPVPIKRIADLEIPPHVPVMVMAAAQPDAYVPTVKLAEV